jgi:hypothetical protein
MVPPDQAPQETLNGWWIAAGTTLTVAGVVSGVAFSIHASDNASKVERLASGIGSVGCEQPAAPAACRSLLSAASAHDRQNRWALLSYGGAGAMALSTLLYALIAGSDGPSGGSAQHPGSSLQLTKMGRVSDLGLQLSGRF